MRGTRFASLAAMLAFSSPALAGPPFLTDDPVPVDYGHWEVYGFSAATHAQGDTGGILGGVEVNYGAAPDLQLHAIVPVAFDDPAHARMQTGLGDIELGAKYRLIGPGRDGWQVGAFPLLEIPAGDANRGLGTGHLRAYFPLWLQKDWGKWTTYGGGGYWVNPGAGNRNYWFAGWLLQRQVTDNLALGGEIFHQTANAAGGRDATGFNIGAVYDFSANYHLLLSAGRGLQNAQTANEFSYYFGVQWTN
ncbi:MAG: transporter [Proteobacteria bacterium]|nr:transporter [Pseudomonadota bacterium]